MWLKLQTNDLLVSHSEAFNSCSSLHFQPVTTWWSCGTWSAGRRWWGSTPCTPTSSTAPAGTGTAPRSSPPAKTRLCGFWTHARAPFSLWVPSSFLCWSPQCVSVCKRLQSRAGNMFYFHDWLMCRWFCWFIIVRKLWKIAVRPSHCFSFCLTKLFSAIKSEKS